MTNYPLLPNSPLIEALIDIRVEGVSDLTPLHDFNKGAEEKFSIRREMHEFNIEMPPPQGNEKPQARTSNTLIGYQFLTSENVANPDGDAGWAMQARINGFNYSKIRKYEDWATFSDEASEWWAKYVAIARPEKVTRVALRYINRIELPWPFKRFDEYLSTVPLLSPDIDRGMSSYLMRLQLPQPPTSMAILTQLVDEINDDTKSVYLTFDIDVFDVKQYEPDSQGIWDTCNNLREIKNRLFFGSITEKAKELFQ